MRSRAPRVSSSVRVPQARPRDLAGRHVRHVAACALRSSECFGLEGRIGVRAVRGCVTDGERTAATTRIPAVSDGNNGGERPRDAR